MLYQDEPTYLGWTTRATWNAHLWLTSQDEGTYQAARITALEASNVGAAAQALEAMCREGWGSYTPDDLPLDEVYWPEVAQAFREEG